MVLVFIFIYGVQHFPATPSSATAADERNRPGFRIAVRQLPMRGVVVRYKKRHKRSRVLVVSAVGVTALAIGGGALMMTDNNASAGQSPNNPR
jgi:hypothetical protein